MPKRPSAPLDAIPAALAKTGFLLEHSVSEEFRKAGWTVIGNRYYVDDVDGRARELDLVAYQLKKGKEIDVCTTVLVSCKKDAVHTWAFMSKDKPKTDPNFDWDPVHYWTDVEPLNLYMGESKAWRQKYVSSNAEVQRAVFNTKRDVFAFQLISSDGNSPKNDAPIFDCVTGLLKALDYEISALPDRQKGKKRLYFFTLLGVVDAPLVDVQYNSGDAAAVEVESLLHLARYMVHRKELLAHIHFVRSDKLSDFISSLNKLSIHNEAYVRELVKDSYKSIGTSDKVRDFFAERLSSRILWRINGALRKASSDAVVEALSLSMEKKCLEIAIDAYGDDIDILNADVLLLEKTKDVLVAIARYEGSFKFVSDAPF